MLCTVALIAPICTTVASGDEKQNKFLLLSLFKALKHLHKAYCTKTSNLAKKLRYFYSISTIPRFIFNICCSYPIFKILNSFLVLSHNIIFYRTFYQESSKQRMKKMAGRNKHTLLDVRWSSGEKENWFIHGSRTIFTDCFSMWVRREKIVWLLIINCF